MLSRTADHALRALLFLARQEDGRPVNVDRISDALGAPRNYLGKTLHTLASRGMLEGVRGPAGGYRLSESPSTVTIDDLLGALDESPEGARKRCLLGDRPCDGDPLCGAHRRWSETLDAARAPLRTTTLADLLADEPSTNGHGS